MQRKRHLSSKAEAAVSDIVATLQRPADELDGSSFDRLGAISRLSNLMQLSGEGSSGRADKLRTASVQVSCLALRFCSTMAHALLGLQQDSQIP